MKTLSPAQTATVMTVFIFTAVGALLLALYFARKNKS